MSIFPTCINMGSVHPDLCNSLQKELRLQWAIEWFYIQFVQILIRTHLKILLSKQQQLLSDKIRSGLTNIRDSRKLYKMREMINVHQDRVVRDDRFVRTGQKAEKDGSKALMETVSITNRLQKGVFRPEENYDTLLRGLIKKQKSYLKQIFDGLSTFKSNSNLTQIPASFRYQSSFKSSYSSPRTFLNEIIVPKIFDDVHQSILDWSSSNTLAIGNDKAVIFVTYSELNSSHRSMRPGDHVTAVKFSNENLLAVGTIHGKIMLRDMVKERKILQRDDDHIGRINSIDWYGNLFATASKEGVVSIRDTRMPELVYFYKPHLQDINRLKWHKNGIYIASGGVDKDVKIHCYGQKKDICCYNQHGGTVRGLDWVPGQGNLLLSGSGGPKPRMSLFNLNTLTEEYSFQTQYPVHGILFSQISNQMVSIHTSNTEQVQIWEAASGNWKDLSSVFRVECLAGHRMRPLYIAGSPSGQMIATGSGDGTVKVWKVFNTNSSRKVDNLSLPVLHQ